jgi:phospholipid/cholesterol/gamma-HCH transport system substrate-binding protein
MPTRAQNVRLGAFLLATLGLFAFALAVVGGFEFWRKTAPYYVLVEGSVAGLEDGSEVTMRGVPVGFVERIALDERALDHVVIELAIDDDVRVPANARAAIALGGISGVRRIDIVEGDLGAGVLPPGSTIAQAPTTLDRFEDKALVLIDEAIELIHRLHRVARHIDDVAAGVDAEAVARTIDGIDRALASFTAASDELRETMADGRTDLHRTLGNADRAAAELETLLEGANRLLRANDDDLRAAVRDLRQAARSFRQLSRELRAQPSRLLRSPPPKARVLP